MNIHDKEKNTNIYKYLDMQKQGEEEKDKYFEKRKGITHN